MKRVEALSIKAGPTQSGIPSNITPPPVGGDVTPIFGGEIVSLVIVSLLVIAGFLLTKKSNIFLRLLTRLGS